MKDLLVGSKNSVRWPDNEYKKFKAMVDECRGFRGFADLFEDAPKNFDRTISRIYDSGVSHPNTYRLIMNRVTPQKQIA